MNSRRPWCAEEYCITNTVFELCKKTYANMHFCSKAGPNCVVQQVFGTLCKTNNITSQASDIIISSDIWKDNQCLIYIT